MSWLLRLKTSQVVFMIVIGGVLALFNSAKATDIILDDNTTPYSDTTCYNFTTDTVETCGSTPSISSTPIYFGQKLDLKEGEEITSIVLYGNGTPHASNHHQLFILDNDQFLHLQSTGQLTALATSTDRLDFASFAISYTMPVDAVLPLWIVVKNWSSYPTPTATDLVVLRPDSYPRRSDSYYQPSSLASAFRSNFSEMQDAMDLHITVYTPERNLSILSPQNGQVYTTYDQYREFYINGSCSENLQLRMFAIQEGLDKYYNVTCSTTISFWEIQGMNLPDGYYSLRASSTNNSQIGSGFWYQNLYASSSVASTTPTFSEIYTKIKNWSCNVPYLSWDPCADISSIFISIFDSLTTAVKTVFGSFRATKPYSYVPELYDIFSTALETTTSTTPLATFVVPTSTNFLNTKFQGTFHLFDSTTLTSILPANQWTVIRSFASAFFYLLFGFWLYKKVIHSV